MGDNSTCRQKRTIRLAYKVQTSVVETVGRTGQKSTTVLPLHKLLGRPLFHIGFRHWRRVNASTNSVLRRPRHRSSTKGTKR